MRRIGKVVAPLVCAGVVLAGSSQAKGQSFQYQAALGTVPSSQGWALNESGSPSPATVNGGLLNSTTVTNSQLQYWDITSANIDFALGASIEARVRINNSSYFNDGFFKRSGWNMLLSDNAGRFVMAGISNDRVHLLRDNNVDGSEAAAGMMGSFAIVRLDVLGNTATLRLNGTPVLTTSVSAPGGTSPNQIHFGDSSILALSNTDVDWVNAEAVLQKTISGTIGFASFVGNPGARAITFELVDGSNTTVQTQTLNLDGSNGYSFPTSLANGTYDVYVKGTTWLRKKIAAVAMGSGGAIVSTTLDYNGDLDNNDVIDSDDFDILVADFGGSGAGDIDGSGGTDSDDFDILVANFGLGGD